MNQNQSENWGGNRELDYDRFYNACDPLKPLKMNDEDRKYYTDFASVRGGKIIDRIKEDVKTLGGDSVVVMAA